jgi:hypothetical protein
MGTPGSSLLDLGHLAFEEPFLNVAHCAPRSVQSSPRSMAYLPGKAESPVVEAERIEHGLKWSPVKAFAKVIPNGIGKSSNWRLFVEYLTRAGEQVPENGVPFTAILTISDPFGEKPVFTDMRQSLQALGVRIEDIRTAARVATRI